MSDSPSTPAGLLASVTGPGALKRLSAEQLTLLAAEIRDFLVAKVSKTGGHLGPNLGVVEMTLAMHRVFDSPRDKILFDTGHQAYVHKIVTGRQDGFDLLRQRGGLTGYPSQAESEHDLIENSHASTALSYADGLAKAFALRGEDRHVVAVVGDGALTGGMCWEALNNIAATKNRLVIVVNDNGRSYAPTIGGLADHLSTLRLNPGYEKVLDLVKDALGSTPLVGKPVFEVLHAVKRGIKDAVSPQPMFEDLGLKYIGPVDGHDQQAMESALRRAKGFNAPVIVHAVTRKGYGYRPAEQDEADCLHGPGAFDPQTGALTAKPSLKWTKVFAEELVKIADERPDVVGITAAMAEPTGIAALAKKYPDRAYDVGIAEQHAATSAAGLAMGGLHPVVAVYATFLNRAFDQVLLDVAMHRLPVTFVLDRAGITGPDGPSHYGIWDMSVFGAVPGLRIAAPRDAATLREELREAVAVDDGPTIVRFPTGAVAADTPAVRRVGQVDVLREAEKKDILLVAVGSFVGLGLDAAERLAEQGYGVTVVDPRWVRPVPIELTGLAAQHRLVVTLEDGIRAGGVGDAVAAALRDAGVHVPLRDFGVPAGFHPHGTRAEILASLGLTAQDVARDVTGWVSGLDAGTSVAAPAI
ncbi:1-deoxy-D-xylulose-5-phosphate synthase [Actinoplanes sp. SE50]|uniref:1-deoxy-D-xylulose-5-phosphate synthase n=1 Tax=unclassified Actinoplanes TaxID=2626549 RepID=UPI00023EC1A7|nr:MULTISPECIES: 1-deoxy-D-xylulose-5-phosphate synthase [unclassified Actinoplanes]AEV87978.1 1-deoxy-D-xylulose-5-phosphate synthase [Actinoplanes sp. SE50/110]ATO86382.1 1-deoxy-D-xylulose-5-phosphate synthase [Actinoplanes sp. SE50]SLM03797.1 1-deoxy-D-xylulose-5-phosphate synthase [Actinoplanes sp. SE50/110]